jgi:hypothetical protein
VVPGRAWHFRSRAAPVARELLRRFTDVLESQIPPENLSAKLLLVDVRAALNLGR